MNARLVARMLKEPFPVESVGWKPQMVKNNRALAVAYIDARDVMERLDEAVGVGGWADRYEVRESGSVVCHLRVKIDGEWVEKCDVGSPSEQTDSGDQLKAAFSDALKRAAVKYGVGRYLYSLPLSWSDYDAVTKKVTPPTLPPWAVPQQYATPQQVCEMEELAKKMESATVEAWLYKAKADEWADLTQSQIGKAIVAARSLTAAK